MKFLDLFPYQQFVWNFDKLFDEDLDYYCVHLKVIIFLWTSLVVLDIEINKLVVFFDMFVTIDVSYQYKFLF